MQLIASAHYLKDNKCSTFVNKLIIRRINDTIFEMEAGQKFKNILQMNYIPSTKNYTKLRSLAVQGSKKIHAMISFGTANYTTLPIFLIASKI